MNTKTKQGQKKNQGQKVRTNQGGKQGRGQNPNLLQGNRKHQEHEQEHPETRLFR
jgi:hypothetical protein